jgi:transcriptional regulator with XRE-family HTH domain
MASNLMGWKEEFGANLRRIREEADETLRTLAAKVGVAPETIRQYELGRIPDADKLAKIAMALKTTEFVLDDLKILVAQKGQDDLLPGTEQLTLDFSAEYAKSSATIQIRPGSIALTLRGIRRLQKAG